MKATLPGKVKPLLNKALWIRGAANRAGDACLAGGRFVSFLPWGLYG